MKLTSLLKLIKIIKKIYTTAVPFKVQDYILAKFNCKTLSQIEFHIVDHCNLNCAHCDNFTPLSPEWYADINTITNDFKQLSKIYNHIENIYILGGEPLLHPQLLDFFKPIREIYPNSNIILLSNGILVEKQPSLFWDTLKKYDITLSMTKYPINVDYNSIIQKCEKLGIKSFLFSSERFGMFDIKLNYKGTSDIKTSYEICSRKKCHVLRDGKIYHCTFVPNIKFINNYFGINFKIDQKDSVDIYKETSPSKINKFLSETIPFCKYCPQTLPNCVEYSHSKKELSEWIDENSL